MANAVGQIGCVTGFIAIFIIAIAFFAGQWLDNLLGVENGLITVVLMVGTFPVTLYAIVRVSLSMVARAQKQAAAVGEQKEPEIVNEEENQV